MGEKDLQTRAKTEPARTDGHVVWVPPGYELATGQPLPEHGPHLWDYIWLVWRRRWLVLLAFLFCAGLAALTAMRAAPVYEATAKLRIEPETPKILGFDDVAAAETNDWRSSFLETQRQIIQNRTLARQVVEQLNLFAEPAEAEGKGAATPSLLAGFADYLKSFRATPRNAAPLDPVEAAAEELRGRVNTFVGSLAVSPIRDTQMVEVKFLAPDRKQCAEVANALCEAYIRFNYQSKFDSYNYAREWLKQKMDDLKGKLEESEEALYKFAGGQDILPTPEGKDGSTKQPELAQLEETGLKIAQAERELFDKELQLKSLESGTSATTYPSGDPRIQKLLENLAETQVKYDQARQQLGPELGEMRALEAAKKRLETQLVEERQRALQKARLEREQAKRTYDFLKASYDQQRKTITETQQRFIQYNILRREADVNRELYNSLLQRWKEVGISSGLKAGNVSIVEPAEPPSSPKYPDKRRTVGLGGMLGLLVGLALAFFLDYMDTTVKGPEEVERVAQLAALGCVPHYGHRRRGHGQERAVELITHKKPKSAFAESIRYLRTSVLYSLPGRSPKTLLVTSSLPGEGKTTISINLAIAFAQRDQRVLLLDADLKRPAVHKFFDVDRYKGLTEVLTGKLNGEAIVSTQVQNLFLLPSGSKAPNPVDLLDSDVMRDLLVSLADKFDHIIIDSAPLMGLADTSVLIPYVDGVVLVVRPGKTPRAVLRRVKDKLTGMQARILGVALNDPSRGPGQEYGYGHGYGYVYGPAYGEEHARFDDEDGETERAELAEARGAETALPPPRECRGG